MGGIFGVLNGIVKMYYDIDDLDKRTKILISISRVKSQGGGGNKPDVSCCGVLDQLCFMMIGMVPEDDDDDDDDGDEDDEEDDEEEAEVEEEDGSGAPQGTRYINLAQSSIPG